MFRSLYNLFFSKLNTIKGSLAKADNGDVIRLYPKNIRNPSK